VSDGRFDHGRAELGRAEFVIVGLGPVGAVLATLLGRRGADVVVLDGEREPAPYPRAIAADGETLRTLLDVLQPDDPGQLFALDQRVEVRDARQRLLTTVCFPGAEDVAANPLGLPGLSFFHQPTLERTLRAALGRLPNVRVHLGQAVRAVRDEPDAVTAVLDNGSRVHASWLVGCDGASSLVRRSRGIAYGGRTFAEPWVVIDIDAPTPLSHLPHFRYVLDPARPTVTMPRPGGHRFEFMVLPGEDPTRMAAPEQVRRFLAPYLAPLPAADRAQLRTVRAAPYTFHSRTAARWRDGRVLLAGDAAHTMPPFGGQGLGAGIGDAAALAWRLDEVGRRLAPPRLLDAYERERRPRVDEMMRTAHAVGRLLTPTSPLTARAVRLGLRAVAAAPVVGARFRAGSLRSVPRVPVPTHERRICGGYPLPNPRVRAADGTVLRLDALVPRGWVAFGRGCDPRDLLPASVTAALDARGAVFVMVAMSRDHPAPPEAGCAVIHDLDGTLLACWNTAGPAAACGAVLLGRPDRFIAAVSGNRDIVRTLARLTAGATVTDDD
jgi:3-(3-hydroxy-phenyl)propionate hydroxylase